MRKGGFEFCRRMTSPEIDFEIKAITVIRPLSHAFAPSWCQNWCQAATADPTPSGTPGHHQEVGSANLRCLTPQVSAAHTLHLPNSWRPAGAQRVLLQAVQDHAEAECKTRVA